MASLALSLDLATRDSAPPGSVLGPMARAYVRAHSRHWPTLRPYLYAEVSGRPWRKTVQWIADLQLEQGDLARTQWNAVTAHPTREAAAAEATSFVLTALPLLERSCETGETQQTPGMRRAEAAQAALELDPRHLELVAAVEAADAALAASGDGPGWHVAAAQHRAARDALERYAREWERRWHGEHGWREYA